MTPRQRELARQVLRLPNATRTGRGTNFFAGPGHDSIADWLAMTGEGLATKQGPISKLGGGLIFRLTLAGARAALDPGERLDPEDFPEARADV